MVSVIKTIRTFQQVIRILFTKEQRLLLKFQSKDIMRSTSEDSDDNQGYNNIVHTMSSKHPVLKKRVNGKIKDLLDKYKNRDFTEIDKKIIKGVVQKEFGNPDDELEEGRLISSP